MLITKQLNRIALFLGPVVIWLAILHTSAVEAQDARMREQQKELDLSGAGSLTYSPDEKLMAGLTKLYGDSGPGSLVKVWSVREKRLLHKQ